MHVLIALPILIPLTTAIICVFARRSRRVQRITALVGAIALLLAGAGLVALVSARGIQASHIGGWSAPIGISLVVDRLSAVLVLITGLIATLTVVYSFGTIDRRRELFGFYPLVHTMLMGVCGSFTTGDLFNLYVWFEVMLMSSFVLLTLGGERGQLEGSIKYVALNLISSAIFLSAVGLIYGMTGTLNMADLAERLPRLEEQGLVTTVSTLFIIAFGIKAGVFPLFFWLPASYHTPPAPVSALFAALLTKVGAYSLIRMFTLVFVGEPQVTHRLLLWIAGATMLVGVFGALAQRELRRALAFLIISHIGYMLIGLGLMQDLPPGGWASLPESGPEGALRAVILLGMAGTIFYMIHHIVVKAALFFLAGAVERLEGDGRLDRLGALAIARPRLSVLYFLAAMALGGVPPLSGFFAKFGLIRASLDAKQWTIGAIALVTGLLILYAMTKLWSEVFWKERPEDAPPTPETDPPGWELVITPCAVLVVVAIAIGLFAGPIFEYCQIAAEQVLDTGAYRAAVLGEGGGR